MWCFRPLLLLLAYGVSTAFHNSFKPVYKHADAGRLDRSFRLGDSPFDPKKSSIVPVNEADMKYVAYLLANLTEHLDTSPEKALTLASQNMGWLYSRDIPGLTQKLLDNYPTLRQDGGMMRAYMFLMDFLEVVSKETSNLLKSNQALMKEILEAVKTSEEVLNSFINVNKEKLTSAEFQVYLDTEIENQEINSPMENLLTTLKLRLLDEQGKSLGVDVTLLPKLAAESDPAELRIKTLQHLDSYDRSGKELFLQTLRIMMTEMKKRYKKVDPLLLMNLREVEKITESQLR